MVGRHKPIGRCLGKSKPISKYIGYCFVFSIYKTLVSFCLFPCCSTPHNLPLQIRRIRLVSLPCVRRVQHRYKRIHQVLAISRLLYNLFTYGGVVIYVLICFCSSLSMYSPPRFCTPSASSFLPVVFDISFDRYPWYCNSWIVIGSIKFFEYRRCISNQAMP